MNLQEVKNYLNEIVNQPELSSTFNDMSTLPKYFLDTPLRIQQQTDYISNYTEGFQLPDFNPDAENTAYFPLEETPK